MTAREWLDAAQARADAATKGPWRCDGLDDKGAYFVRTGDAGLIRRDPGTVIAEHMVEEDADFAAHSRTDLPRAIAALRAVLDEVDRLQGWADNNRSILTSGVGLVEATYHDAYGAAARNVRDAITAALDGAAVREQIGDLT